MNAFAAIVVRDVTLAFRAGGGALQAVTFFALTAVVFSFAIGPDITLLTKLAGPILWTGALLSTLVSLDRVFQADYEDGSLDVIVETSAVLEVSVLAKVTAHWLSTCLPLIIATPLLAILLNLEPVAYAPLVLSLLVGTPALALLGAFAAALAVSMRRANVLVSIIVGPLYAPALIFGVGAAQAGALSEPHFAPNLMLAGAVTLFSLIIAPFGAAAALRANMS